MFAAVGGEERRWSGGADFWRARHRQVATHRRAFRRVESEPHPRLRCFCAPHHRHSVLYPFIARLERAAGFTRDDTIDGQLLLSLEITSRQQGP